jgi:formylglycine-generating enzyme required for sulfatase activity
VNEWNEEQLTKADGAPERVHRGGAWHSPAATCAVGYRHRSPPADRHLIIGLRLARVPSSELNISNPNASDAKNQQAEWAAKLKMPVEATNGIGMQLMLIPPGEGVEKPFLMGKYEVTQGEFETVMGYNPSEFTTVKPKLVRQDVSRFPVEKVNWFDAVEFCNKLSEKESLPPYYKREKVERKGASIEKAVVQILGGKGYHLPTDAEWTWACAAASKSTYYFGDEDSKLGEYGWYQDNSESRTHHVGKLKPSAFGLYDMHGNVREWNENVTFKSDTGAPERVHRGGNWHDNPAAHCAVGYLYRSRPATRSYSVGLRLENLVPMPRCP